jgi:hypothetical protein
VGSVGFEAASAAMAYVAAGLLGPDLWAWVCPVLSASIYTLNMGSRKVAEAATSGACVLAQLRGYAGVYMETSLHGVVGWSQILSGSWQWIAIVVLGGVVLVALSCMIFV